MSDLTKYTEIDTQALERADALLSELKLSEKLGQLNQHCGEEGNISDHLRESIRGGSVGSVLNEVNTDVVNELQRIAVEESRCGIPLLIGRDVIHGFKTIFPIPLGQAASWCESSIELGAKVAATEAKSQGVNWTFAPMIDITRDPRWGRVAESLGEDPFLCAKLGAAMIRGFQTQSLANDNAIVACAKHFAGYGYSESGRDYSFANISENELRNTVFPPFKMASDIGVSTFMTSFSDLNGIPASGNAWLNNDVLREEWGFKGFIVSDWASIQDLKVHGLSEDDKHSAQLAVNAGVDMEMVSRCYADHMESLLKQDQVTLETINNMVRRILYVKFALGLFENPYTQPDSFPSLANHQHLNAAKKAAEKSCVLLKNHEHVLPLKQNAFEDIALIGPLADDPYEQLGTWIFDGDPSLSVTCAQAISAKTQGRVNVHCVKGLETSRSFDGSGFEEAIHAAERSDLTIMVMGEESILSGEAHCRAELGLPGAQNKLIDKIVELGKPVVLVIMAGRPLTIGDIVDKVDAVLYAWHPGTMGGPAIADLLFGDAVPSGKLPITFPRVVGQIPLYYSQKRSGRPVYEHSFVHQNDIPVRAPQTSLGMASNHLDVHFSPLFPFGFGLSYAQFEYKDIRLSSDIMTCGEPIVATVRVCNHSDFDADEIVQLYINDPVASTTRPVKELKGFQRVRIQARGEVEVSFEIHEGLLSFYGQDNTCIVESGKFHVYIAPHSNTQEHLTFTLTD